MTLRYQRYRIASGQTDFDDGEDFSSFASAIDASTSSEISYEVAAMSDSVRVTKNYRACSTTIDPMSESSVALLMTTGRMLVYTVMSSERYLFYLYII